MSELQEKVKSAVDWRAQFAERPLAMMGLAFGGGVLLSALLPSISRSNEKNRPGSLQRVSTDYASSNYPGAEHKTEILRPAKKSLVWKKASDALNGVQGALLAVAATKVSNYLEELIPGFHEHYRKQETR